MIRIALSVEGYTEDEFCRQVLAPYLRLFGKEITPIIVTTSREACGTKHKGGCINLSRVSNEIEKLLHHFDYVTTFYDYYGFMNPSKLSICDLEIAIAKEVNYPRTLIPYIQQYEFETLLFADEDYYESYFSDSKAKTEISNIVSSCGGVEHINNSPETAPSKRIIKLFNNYAETYDKVFHGPGIANDIGLSKIKSQCPRFNDWLEKLVKL